MKILYVSPENVTGGLALFAEGHRRRGNECRWITFFRSLFKYEEDLCFNLFGMPHKKWVWNLRSVLNKAEGIDRGTDLEGNPPIWSPSSALDDYLYQFRDIINTPRIRQTIKKYDLDNYDIYHFEQGIDPFKNGRWVKELVRKDKPIVCFYHGTDIRNRGIIPPVHEASRLNLTSEIDLLPRIQGMKYLYLPIDTSKFKPAIRTNPEKIKVCHIARNRRLKGSDQIEAIVRKLSGKYLIEWVMIENTPHDEVLRIMADCDIFIDQITDAGGWGYGASTVEALSLGLPVLTRINDDVDAFLGEHPFKSVTPESLERALVDLINDNEMRQQMSEHGLKWVNERHGLKSVMERLYEYYGEAGII